MSNTHMDVILWSVWYFSVYFTSHYCTIFLSRTNTRLKMYLVISCGIMKKKISLCLSAFCSLCYAGKLSPAGFSFKDSGPCWWGHTAYWLRWAALPRGQTEASHGLIQVGHGGIDIELGNRIPWAGPTLLGDWSGSPGLHQLLVEPVPLKDCQVAHKLKHIHQCRWWRFPMCICAYISFIQNILLSEYSFV